MNNKKSIKMPALFIGHGNPMNVLDEDNRFNQAIQNLAKKLPKPKAILMISAHWYDESLQVSSGENPPLIYDFYGFPRALSEVHYPAKGSPWLCEQVLELLDDFGVQANANRGFDHGMWTVLKPLYPAADVPVVQLSICHGQPMSWHIALAKRLAVLRDEGVLIVGSGNIVHNLRLVDFRGQSQYPWAQAFGQSVNAAILQHDLAALADFHRFEGADLAVPTLEHYLPLIYVMATAMDDEPVLLFNDELDLASISMTSVAVGVLDN